jgi:hypothetical protein
VLIQALRCSGIGSDWLGSGVAVVPPVTSCACQLAPCGWVQPPTISISSPAFQPLLPPPRQTIACS